MSPKCIHNYASNYDIHVLRNLIWALTNVSFFVTHGLSHFLCENDAIFEFHSPFDCSLDSIRQASE